MVTVFGLSTEIFVKYFIIVNHYHLLPLSVQIVLWIILIVCDASVSLVSLFGVVYTSLIFHFLWTAPQVGPSFLSEKP